MSGAERQLTSGVLQRGRALVDENSAHIEIDGHGFTQWNSNQTKPLVKDNHKVIIGSLKNLFQKYSDLTSQVCTTMHSKPSISKDSDKEITIVTKTDLTPIETDERIQKATEEAYKNILLPQVLVFPEYVKPEPKSLEAALADGALANGALATALQGKLFCEKTISNEELLASDVADLLESKAPDQEVYKDMEVFVDILKHCSQRDVYLKFHQLHLAKRLSGKDKDLNKDWEEHILQKIVRHTKVASDWVKPLERMITDYTENQTREDKWKQFGSEGAAPKTVDNLSITVRKVHGVAIWVSALTFEVVTVCLSCGCVRMTRLRRIA